MNIDDINAWISTEAGAAWLEEQKAPLLAKNKELLDSLHTSNARIAQAEQRSADASKLLDDERRASVKSVIDVPLAAALKENLVFEALFDVVTPEIRQAYGLTVIADGDNRKALGKITENGKEREATLAECVKHWADTDRGKASRLSGSSGGGGLGSSGRRASSVSLSNIRNLTAEEILENLSSLTKE